MKKTASAILAFFAFAAAHAQTVTPVVVANDGGFTKTASGSIAWTIGEPVSETYKQNTNITTNGFHQADLEVIDYIGELTGGESMVVFPNPVADILNVNFKGMKAGSYALTMVDAAGRLVLSESALITEQGEKMSLKVSEFASGNYFLNITGDNFARTIKVTKVTH